jgi:hypothetical protein
MPITSENYGSHEGVAIITFGTGDILMTKAQESGKIADNILCFSESPGHEIGEVSNDFKDKNINELPKVAVVMRFDKPESITALIHSLAELQKTVFENQKAEAVCA